MIRLMVAGYLLGCFAEAAFWWVVLARVMA